MSRSRSRSISRKRSQPSPAFDRRYSNERTISRDRTVRRRDKKLSKERERTRYRSRSSSVARSRSLRDTRRYSRSRSRNGRKDSGSRESPYVCPGDLRRQKYENPEKSRCIGVFGLSEHTTKHQIEKIFSEYGPIEQVRVVVDSKSHRSRGYCFVYFMEIEDATTAKESCANLTIDSRRVRVDYSITSRAHTPTPGVYKGNMLRGRHHRQRDDPRRRSRYGEGSHRRSRSHSPRNRRYR